MGAEDLNAFEWIDYQLTSVPYQVYSILAVIALLGTLVTVYDYSVQQNDLQQQQDLQYQIDNINNYTETINFTEEDN